MPQKKQSGARKRVGQIQQYSPTGRKKRKDADAIRLLPRDELVLTWIGQQYAMRLDQIQELLGRLAVPGATHEDQLSESATRSVIPDGKRLDGFTHDALTQKSHSGCGLPKMACDASDSPTSTRVWIT